MTYTRDDDIALCKSLDLKPIWHKAERGSVLDWPQVLSNPTPATERMCLEALIKKNLQVYLFWDEDGDVDVRIRKPDTESRSLVAEMFYDFPDGPVGRAAEQLRLATPEMKGTH